MSKKIFTQLPRHPKTVFDEDNFLEMLNNSVSLTHKEKENAIKAIPQLTQDQIDKMISIFEEEKQKFVKEGLDMEEVRQVREKPFHFRHFFHPELNPLKFLRPSNLIQIFKVLKAMSGFSGKKR